jgi:hypothetical protein
MNCCAVAEETDLLEPTLLDELICHIASLASVYHKVSNLLVSDTNVRPFKNFYIFLLKWGFGLAFILCRDFLLENPVHTVDKTKGNRNCKCIMVPVPDQDSNIERNFKKFKKMK